MSRISVIVKQSCTSAQSISPGPTPAIAYARCGGEPRRLELGEAVLLVQVRVVGRDAEPGDEHRLVGELARPLGAARASIAAAPSVCGQQSSRCSGWHTGGDFEHVVDRDLVLEVGVRVARAVVVVLHRDRREHLARRAELVHVPGGERREQHRRGLAAGEDRVTGGGPRQQALLGRLVAHLLDADHEHDVVHAARDGHRADPERVGARRARVLDAGARDAGEADRASGSCCRRCPPGPTACRAAWRRTRPRPGAGSKPLSTLGDGRVERARGHLLVALVEQLAHLDEPGADDRDPVPAHARPLGCAPSRTRALKP